jgi:hypothetical protein
MMHLGSEVNLFFFFNFELYNFDFYNNFELCSSKAKKRMKVLVVMAVIFYAASKLFVQSKRLLIYYIFHDFQQIWQNVWNCLRFELN